MNSNPFQSAGVYTDFQGLGRLKAEARKESPEAIREVARQFEALFTQTLMKSMRAASFGDPLFGGSQVEFYQEMFDKQMALHLSRGSGLGLTDAIVRQLGGDKVAKPIDPDAPLTLPERLPYAVQPPQVMGPVPQTVQPATPAPERGAMRDAVVPETPVSEPAAVGTSDWRPAGPAEFVESLWPHAQQAAAELGVAPEVLIAQSALETGWGQAVIRQPDGANSFNLFGIKADGRWDGDRAVVNTLEYEDGVAVKRRAAFRSYSSVADSFNDYVAFIKNSPRYQTALQQAGDPKAYLEALQAAGYATDPAYAQKIHGILQRAEFGERLTVLKSDDSAPIS